MAVSLKSVPSLTYRTNNATAMSERMHLAVSSSWVAWEHAPVLGRTIVPRLAYLLDGRENKLMMGVILCLMMYKALDGLGPSYIGDVTVPLSTVYSCASLRSAARGHLVVPATSLQHGRRAFAVAGPSSWTTLPTNRSINNLSCAKKLTRELADYSLPHVTITKTERNGTKT